MPCPPRKESEEQASPPAENGAFWCKLLAAVATIISTEISAPPVFPPPSAGSPCIFVAAPEAGEFCLSLSEGALCFSRELDFHPAERLLNPIRASVPGNFAHD
jgi:hypothetical protein